MKFTNDDSCSSGFILFAISYVLYFKYVEINEETTTSFFNKMIDMMKSTNSQLEFLTLIGIILNAFMQGYVCANHIYVYLIQDIERNPNSIELDDTYKGNLYEYHAQRIHNVLD